jgi:hypothetical protein
VIEDITAHLNVRDAARFEAEMYAAAASIDEFGDEAAQAAVKSKVLSHETDVLERKMRGLTTRGLKNARAEMKRFGALATFTERGLTSFAITAGTYLAPALLSLANSASAAAIGGAGVAGGGLAALAVGLSGVLLIGKQVSGQFKKVLTAFQQQQLAVQLYGKDSDQAAKASAKLWAVTQLQGGTRTLRIVKMWEDLKATFTKKTASARGSLMEMLGGLLRGAGRIMPTFTNITNKSAATISDVVSQMAKSLSGEEMKGTLNTLGSVFNVIAGPLGRAATNVIIVLGRVFKAAAPYVEDFAFWIEKITHNWRVSTKDQGKVNERMDNYIKHLKAWARLGGALGRMFKILFGGSKEQGRAFVDTLTNMINRFDDWLQLMSDTGRMQKWFEGFFDNLRKAGHFIELIFTDQSQAIAMFSDFFARVAAAAISKFIQAWWDADWQGKLLLAWYFLYKVGIFSAIGKVMAERFIAAFVATSMGEVALAQFAAAGTAASAAFVAAMTVGLPVALVVGATLAIESITIGGKKITAPGQNDIFSESDKRAMQDRGGFWGLWSEWGPQNWWNKVRGKQHGGLIPPMSRALVGERGPELATTTPLGTMITPMRSQTLSELPGMAPMATSDKMPQVNVNLQVDRQTLARAVYRHDADIAARRGENA